MGENFSLRKRLIGLNPREREEKEEKEKGNSGRKTKEKEVKLVTSDGCWFKMKLW